METWVMIKSRLSYSLVFSFTFDLHFVRHPRLNELGLRVYFPCVSVHNISKPVPDLPFTLFSSVLLLAHPEFCFCQVYYPEPVLDLTFVLPFALFFGFTLNLYDWGQYDSLPSQAPHQGQHDSLPSKAPCRGQHGGLPGHVAGPGGWHCRPVILRGGANTHVFWI